MKIDKYFHLYGRKNDVMFEEIEKPELKTGKWIRLTNDLAQCSECEDYIDNAISCGYNYCPNCGADMRGVQDE